MTENYASEKSMFKEVLPKKILGPQIGSRDVWANQSYQINELS